VETIRAMSKKRPDGGNHPGHVNDQFAEAD
jgi:hypothetical protein